MIVKNEIHLKLNIIGNFIISNANKVLKFESGLQSMEGQF